MNGPYSSKHAASHILDDEQDIDPRVSVCERAPYSDFATLTLSALFGAALIVFAVGYTTNLDLLCLTGSLGALFFGVGTAPLQFSKCSLITRLGVAGIVSLSTLTLVGSIMVLVPIWHPLLASIAVICAAFVVHFSTVYRSILRGQWRGFCRALCSSGEAVLNPSIVCTVIGTSVWCTVAFDSGHIVPVAGGFLPRISPLWYVGLALVVTGIVLARRKGEACVIFGVLSLVAAITLTPALVYGMPPQAAAKHVDLVQQVLYSHHLNRTASIYDAYSGFFAAIAWVCDLSRVRSSITFAAYWPFIIELVAVVEFRFFFGRILDSRYRIWLSTVFALLVIPVGDFYFAPQSVGFVEGLGIYSLVLGRDWPGLTERVRLSLLAFAGCALAVTHELSPYVIGGALVVLVAFRAARPWYAWATCLLPAILWAVLNWHGISGFVTFGSLGDLSNFAPPKTVSTPGLQRLAIVGESSDTLLIGLLILITLAGIGFLRCLSTTSARHSITPAHAWAFMIAAGVGLVPIAVNPYGNEGIFRAALFGVPWLAVLAAQAIPSNPPRWISAPFGLGVVGLVVLQLISSFGLDNANIIRPEDFHAYNLYMANAPESSFILDLSYGPLPYSATFPEAKHLVAWTSMVPRSTLQPGRPTSSDVAALAQSYIRLATDSGDVAAGDLYALWSPASVQYSVDYGLETVAHAEAWRRLMTESPDWQVVFSSDGTYLFRVTESSVHEYQTDSRR